MLQGTHGDSYRSHCSLTTSVSRDGGHGAYYPVIKNSYLVIAAMACSGDLFAFSQPIAWQVIWLRTVSFMFTIMTSCV